MKYFITILIIFSTFINLPIYSQEERKYIRQGVKDYNENSYEQAELKFRKANELNTSSFEAAFNTGNALYKQGKTEDAEQKYTTLTEKEKSDSKKADLYYNLGNTYLKSQDYQKGIEAYKNALRLRPEDDDARYNLTWALNKLEEQQQQQNQNQEQNQEQNQDQDQEQNQEQDQQQNQDKEENQEQNKQDEQNNQENQPMENKELSKEEMERILKAIEEKEEQVKEKADKERAKIKAVPNEKDW